MVNSYTKRSAFTLIELIFALVIIAISVASIPIMTSAIGKGVENNLVQETIFGASAQMNQVLSFRWDEKSIDESVDPNATGLAQVIDRDGTICDANKIKTGHILQPLHRRCLDDSSIGVSATFGSDGSEANADDVDDFDGATGDLFTGTSSQTAYKDQFTYEIDVNPTTFGGRVSSDDAKEVIVTVKEKDGSGDVVTELKSYTFNIGEVDYHKRIFP